MDSTTFNKILREYEIMRDEAHAELDSRKNEVYNVIPKIREIDEETNKLSVQIAKAILNDTAQAQRLVEEFKEKSSLLKKEKISLLASYDYPEDFLILKYICTLCKDTGFIENEKCRCLKQKLIDYAYKQSNLMNKLSSENFDNFDFGFYSDEITNENGVSARERAQNIYKACIDFAHKFDTHEENLLLSGPTGLGKTFLSNCIAKELLDRGKTVFYQTAFKIFEILEEHKFSKDKDIQNKEKLKMLFDVDLLIVDDLGSEFVNSYTSSEFFNILNSRLLEKKKTIISTNLSMSEFMNLYSERVISRILGHYKLLEFFGEDIRIRKKISANF